jgi:hypothetical protein
MPGGVQKSQHCSLHCCTAINYLISKQHTHAAEAVDKIMRMLRGARAITFTQQNANNNTSQKKETMRNNVISNIGRADMSPATPFPDPKTM